MDELETSFDFSDYLGTKFQFSPTTEQPVHVVKFVFAIAISVQVVLVFKFFKRLLYRIFHFHASLSRRILHRLIRLFRRHESTHDVITAIPVMCKTILHEIELAHESGTSHLELLSLTLKNSRKEIPPSLLVKSAISWLLCDLLLLLSRCNRHKLALLWPERLALEYRTIDTIPYFMERIAHSYLSTKRVSLPVLLQNNESLAKLQYNNSIPVLVLDLNILYIRLKKWFPLLILPKYKAIRSRFDYNLERYRKQTSIREAGRSSSLRFHHQESRSKTKNRLKMSPKDVSEKDHREGIKVDDRTKDSDVENWMLSVTALATVLSDPKLGERQKSYIIRRQMELRNIHSPKRWKWRSALTYLEARLAKSASTHGVATSSSRPSSTNTTPKHRPNMAYYKDLV